MAGSAIIGVRPFAYHCRGSQLKPFVNLDPHINEILTTAKPQRASETWTQLLLVKRIRGTRSQDRQTETKTV